MQRLVTGGSLSRDRRYIAVGLAAAMVDVGTGPPLRLTNGRLADGRSVDITVGADGCITAVDDAVPAAPAAPAGPGHDLGGWLVLPSAVEPHAHLDKALTADDEPNERGDLLGAVEAWHRRWPRLTVEDMATRAEVAARRSLANGITSIRTHVDLGPGLGLRAVEALLEVRKRMAGLVDIQIVAMMTVATSGPDGVSPRALLRDALDAGVDVAGGCPHLDPDPRSCIDTVLDLAAEFERPVDLHVDETLDPAVFGLPVLAERVEATGFVHGVTASHCVSLGMQPEVVQRSVARRVADADVAVVVLPQTNLFLQARGIATAPPRGLTAVAALLDAGVTVAAGADNLQDPFNLVGRADPFETAALMVMAGHLTAEQAWRAVSGATRRALGLPPCTVSVGDRADLLVVPATTVRQAIADAPGDRLVLTGGRVVARSTRTQEVAD